MQMIHDDSKIIRPLAQQVQAIAQLSVQQIKRDQWKRHNDLNAGRPQLLVFPEGAWRELLPEPLHCQHPLLQSIERDLRQRIYYHEHIRDDAPIEGTIKVRKVIHGGQWLPLPQRERPDDEVGAWHTVPVIHNIQDLQQLRMTPIEYDEDTTKLHHQIINEMMGDILQVRLVGVQSVAFSLMRNYIERRGMDQLFWDMYDQPEMIHKFMRIMTDGYLDYIQHLQQMNLLDLNNDDTYHASGGKAYTDQLPADGYTGVVRSCDLWASAEAQELSEVSPEMHAEFALQYESCLLKDFARVGYGCCEALDHKLLDVFRMLPNVHRISVSPFANVETCAKQIGNQAIFSWKPNPAHLVGTFDARKVGQYIGETIRICRDHDCILEMILKDTHTCESHPERFEKWVDVARNEIERFHWPA